MPDMNMMGGMPKPDNHEAAMARADLYKLANYSFKLFKMVKDGDELEGWVQAKITKAADYIASVYHFMEYEMKFSEYGEKLETADVYTENVKREYKRKLTEARVKLEKLRQKNIADLNEGWDDMVKASKERSDKEDKEKGTGKFDKKQTSTGTQYTRKSSTFDDGGKDKFMKKAEKEEKAKKVKEGLFGNSEQDLAKRSPQLQALIALRKNPKYQSPEAKKSLEDRIKKQMDRVSLDKGEVMGPDGKPVAVKEASKPDFLDVDNDKNEKEPMKKALADKKKNPFAKVKEAEDKKCNHTPKGKSCPLHGLKECGPMESVIAEKAVSKAQQKFMGMVHATKKGEKAPSKEVAKAAKDMSAKAAKDFASTKHKGLPAKKD